MMCWENHPGISYGSMLGAWYCCSEYVLLPEEKMQKVEMKGSPWVEGLQIMGQSLKRATEGPGGGSVIPGGLVKVNKHTWLRNK